MYGRKKMAFVPSLGHWTHTTGSLNKLIAYLNAHALALVHVRQCCINNNNCFKASEKEISGGPHRRILS